MKQYMLTNAKYSKLKTVNYGVSQGIALLLFSNTHKLI